MQLTVSSEEPIEHVLAVISALYGVQVTATGEPRPKPQEVDQGITRPRPT